MDLIQVHRGFEICRTSAGDLVVIDPEDTVEERAETVAVLASSGALRALFFPSLAEARRAIDDFIDLGLTHL